VFGVPVGSISRDMRFVGRYRPVAAGEA